MNLFLFHYLIILGFALDAIVFTAFLFVPKIKKILLSNFSKSIIVIISLYLLYALLLSGEINDVRIFGSSGYHLRNGIDFYFIDQSHGTYPFFPFLSFYYALANLINEMVPFLTFSFLVKVLTIPVAFLVSRFLRSKEDQLSFLLHPALFGPVVIHGQADIILIYFLFLAFITYQKKHILSGISYGLSILTKTWSLFFLPFVLSTEKQKKLIVFLFVFFVTIFIDVFVYTRLLHSSFRTVLTAAFGHPGSPVGFWGLSYLLSLFRINLGSSMAKYWLIAILAIANLIAWRKKLPVTQGVNFIILFFVCLTLSWGIQYIIWLIPFAYYNKENRFAETFGLMAIPYLLIGYFSIASGISYSLFISLGLIPWGYSIYYLYQKLKV